MLLFLLTYSAGYDVIEFSILIQRERRSTHSDERPLFSFPITDSLLAHTAPRHRTRASTCHLKILRYNMIESAYLIRRQILIRAQAGGGETSQRSLGQCVGDALQVVMTRFDISGSGGSSCEALDNLGQRTTPAIVGSASLPTSSFHSS